MSTHTGTLDEIRAAAFASKDNRRRVDAAASPEAKFAMLEEMQELAEELKRARVTLRPATIR